MNKPINSLAYAVNTVRYERTPRTATVDRGAITRLRDLEQLTSEESDRRHPASSTFGMVLLVAVLASGLLLIGSATRPHKPDYRAATIRGISLCNGGKYYESILVLAPIVKSGGLSEESMRAAQAKLAFAYMRIGDTRNGKRLQASLNSKAL